MVDFPDSPAPMGDVNLWPPLCIIVAELTEKQHLDLIALEHFVALQLVLDLLVPRLPLLLLCAHTATHLEIS